MKRLAALLALPALALMPGCGGQGEQGSKPTTSSPAPVVSAGPTPAATTALADDDYQSEVACRLLNRATQGELSEPIDDETITAIVNAAGASSDQSIKFAGQMLADRQALAVAAAGTDDETSTSVEVQTAAIKLKTACVGAGLGDA
jgi:hypothetical protein